MPPPGPPLSRYASFLRPCSLIWFSIRLHWAEFVSSLRRDGLSAFLHLYAIHEAASAKLLNITSPGFIAFEDTTIVPTLISSASGTILELGPGPGNQIHRFVPLLPSITRIYGIEPNPHFASSITSKIAQNNLQDKYKLLICGIEDSDVLRKEGVEEGTLDAVLSIQVLCAVKDPRVVVRECWRLLKPGGKFIFWEHGWSRDRVTGLCQALLNPAWSTFVGCHLTRNVLKDILEAGEWENPGEIEEPEDRFSPLPRIQGVLVKKA